MFRKSHYCKENFNNLDTIVIATDKIRKEITGSDAYDKESNSVNRKRILKIAKNNNCKSEALVFMTPIEICIDINRKRDIERRVPMEVILNIANFIPDKVED